MKSTAEESLEKTNKRLFERMSEHDELQQQMVALIYVGIAMFLSATVWPILWFMVVLLALLIVIWGVWLFRLEVEIAELHEQFHTLQNALLGKQPKDK